MPWVGLIMGAAQIGIGIAQKNKANREAKDALAKRKPYQTPAELYKVLNATQNKAQTGYDPATLQYLTNESDRAFDSALSTARNLGADPNDMSAMFDQKIQGMMKIGAENHALNMQNFNQYLGVLGAVGDSKTAEWQSEQNMVKDLQQKAGQDKADATAQIGEGMNTGLASAAALWQSNLYKDDEDKFDKKFGVVQGENASNFAKENNMTYGQYKRAWNRYGSKFQNFKM